MYLLTNGEKVRDLYTANFDKKKIIINKRLQEDNTHGNWHAIDMGDNIVAAVDEPLCRLWCRLRIWRKDTGELLMNEFKDFFYDTVLRAKNNIIMIVNYNFKAITHSDSDENDDNENKRNINDNILRIYKYKNELLKITHKFQYYQNGISDTDIDGEFVLTANKYIDMKLWKISDPLANKLISAPKCMTRILIHTGSVKSLILTYPHVITVSGKYTDKPGVRIWNVETGVLLHNMFQHINFEKILTNGYIIAANRCSEIWRETDLFTINDLKSNNETNIWTRKLEGIVSYSINKTMIIGRNSETKEIIVNIFY